MAVFFANTLLGEGDKATFLIGESTYGHYQIEMACETCHTDAFGGTEILQNACTQCHAEELETAHDSHPKSKFTDPRNADRIKVLDARYCVNCHTEHKLERTHAMGVTLPDDYCWHCHQNIAEDRPSHIGLAFDSCASAGCHNYHDNRAIYEDFLLENATGPWYSNSLEALSARIHAATTLAKHTALSSQTSQYQGAIAANPDAAADWQHSSHAQAGVDCGGCHTEKNNPQWIDKPNHTQCQACHRQEVDGFLRGKHGMRMSSALSSTLPPITPAQAHLPFTAEAQHLPHGCNACHGAHQFELVDAAVSACLDCHNDQHSTQFLTSPHGQHWQRNPDAADAVSCASCHMPRREALIKGNKVYTVEHNQNGNLRPNEKMIRGVCMNCHSLAFSIDALADSQLLQNNFNGKPRTHIESIDWALKRAKSPDNVP